MDLGGPTLYEAIAAKRDGRALPERVWRGLVDAYLGGEVADYQMAAMLMAVAIRGLGADELHALTAAMAESGDLLDLAPLAPVVDKHSTGGVGDKTTLVVAPLVAACGVRVAKMSGRGLGHTGGTVDKLEAIPGFESTLSRERFERQVSEVGVAVVAQAADLAPADKLLYALRDVTATVESVPLIAASIVCKKVAAGARVVVFDVKTGRGAFMADRALAEELARTLVELAVSFGVRAEAVLTAMDQPLGRAVGNALEVAEAIEVLRGAGPQDLVEVSLALARRMVALGAGIALDAAHEAVSRALKDGAGLAVFRRWIEAQGGSASVVDDPSLLPRAPVARELTAVSGGHVVGIDALAVGRAAGGLGAGRTRKEDRIDPAVGVVCRAKVGDAVSEGDPLAEVHAADEPGARAAIDALGDAWTIGERPPRHPVVLADPVGVG